jgi:carboxyl-terminal processing protease
MSRSLLVATTILFVASGVFAIGFVMGARYHTVLPDIIDPKPIIGLDHIEVDPGQSDTPEDLYNAFMPFWESWQLLQENFVDQPLDTQALVYGAAKGMMNATSDSHTGYMTPEEQEIIAADVSGELEGIGAEVDTRGDFLTIVSPLPGSPAQAAGLRPGDLVVEVDGEDIRGLDTFAVISRVRGPAGSTVSLTIRREGEPDLLKFNIERYKITIPMVESRLLDSGLGYVKINQFGGHTVRDLRTQLKALSSSSPPGMILDLRNNPGGLLNAGIQVASQFISDGPVMIESLRDGSEQVHEARPGGLATDIPLVLLINEGSASAAEIVASAVQDYKRALLVGQTTYGKGTIQTWIDLSEGNGAVRITYARWLSPHGRSVHGVGVTPDVEIRLSMTDDESGLDPQLAAAEALLLEGTNSETSAVHIDADLVIQ